MKPVVSIIIPTHNYGRFLSLAIQSVLAQTYNNLEIIIIDDGSTDNTKKIIEEFKKHRIHYYYCDYTGNPAFIRNKGIQISQGDFIAFLDADDIWYPKKLEEVMLIFAKNPDIGLVCHNEYIVKEDKIITILDCGPCQADMFKQLLFKGNCLATSAVVLRREIIMKLGGFDEDRYLATVEDYDLWMKLAREGVQFYFMNEVLGEYRLHGTNSSIGANNYVWHLKNTINVLNKNFKYVIPQTLKDRLKFKKRVYNIYNKCGHYYSGQNETFKSLQEYTCAFRVLPFSKGNLKNFARVLRKYCLKIIHNEKVE